MANRLSKIVTRTGGKRSTGLTNGTRVDKYCVCIRTISSIDEFYSHLGILLAKTVPEDVRDLLLHLQHNLFDLSDVLTYPAAQFTEDMLLHMDDAITHYNPDLSPLKEFILPGGIRVAAQFHVARTMTHRADETSPHSLNSKSCHNMACPT